MRQTWAILATTCLLATPALAQISAPADGQAMPMRGHAGKMFEGMSAEGRKLLAVEMIESEEKRKAAGDARKAAREKVRAAMLVEPFDQNALRSAFEAERRVASEQQKIHQDHMTSVLAKLSASDRKIFAHSMGKMEQRWGGMRDRLKERRSGREEMPQGSK